MPTKICPICHARVRSDDRSCANCGANLFDEAQDAPVSPEVLVPRLGEHLVEQGYLTNEQLVSALIHQEEAARNGSKLLIGQALTQLGFIDQKILDRAITQQISALQAALQHANQVLENRVAARTRDLQSALDRLSGLNQLKANFVANISHELRTPLTHIKGYTEMVRDGSLGPISDEQETAFSVMDRSIQKLETLIDDLIRFSEAAQQDINLNLQSLPPRYIIQQAFNQARQKSGMQDRKFHLIMEDRLPNVLCDQEKITWVILHLIENAVKFTPDGGMIEVTAMIEDRHIRISISDTGIGIPEDKIDEIFEPFHQLDASTTRKYAGTGLGLALVKRILSAHHAAIKVDSTLGKGTAISFLLPVTGQKTIA